MESILFCRPEHAARKTRETNKAFGHELVKASE
jgi:hypothetical protein